MLSLSDRQVRAKLNARLARGGPVWVSQTRGDRFMRPVPEREPFATLERRFGHLVDQLVVVDEGSVEGMWRDPLGELADRLYPSDRERSYAAASGYLLLEDGRPLAVVKKRSAAADGWFLQEALHAAGLGVPAPDPDERPGHKRPPAERGPRRPPRPEPEPSRSERSSPEERARARAERVRANRAQAGRTAEPSAPPPPPAQSPWEILGIPPDSPREEAKKAFRAQIALYHPDKVAHLAPEFQRLAEERTRALLAAWEAIDRGAA